MNGRDGGREYADRVRRAQERGFRSYWEQRTAPRVLRRGADFGRLSESARESRSAAAGVITLARREGMTVERAAAERVVPMSAVRWWFPQALGPTRDGRTEALQADRALRLRPLFVVDQGLIFVAVRGSRAADLATEISAAQWQFIDREGSAAHLARYQGTRIAGHLVETDPAVLEQLGLQDPNIVEAYRELVP